MADRILELDKGEIIEMVSHEELLKKDERYASLLEYKLWGSVKDCDYLNFFCCK
jgi:ABC-type multidrug transport system fused ATPase/permease subunit